MEFTVDVTQEDIDSGRPKSMCGCPIALALTRKLGSQANVTVPGLGAFFDFWGKRRRGMLPFEARKFVTAFDIGYSAGVRPLSFVLELLELGQE